MEHVTADHVFDDVFLKHTASCERCRDLFGQPNHVDDLEVWKPRGIVHAYSCDTCRGRLPYNLR